MSVQGLQGSEGIVKERPILFSGPMVRALIDGRKSHTRRIVRVPDPGAFVEAVEVREGVAFFSPSNGPNGARSVRCPYGQPGDWLWVRETFTRIRGNGVRLWYRADGEPTDRNGNVLPTSPCEPRWCPSIFMTRAESRLTLEVVSVRVERLHAITEEDARAEGVVEGRIPADEDGPGRVGYVLGDDDGRCVLHPTRRKAFEVGWDGINGERAPWASNPWVWVVGFSVVHPTRSA